MHCVQEGYRYNALHVACAKRQPALVQLLLDTLQDAHFLELLYPDDSIDVRNRRKVFLLDLYLNTPDKGVRRRFSSTAVVSVFF